MGLAVVQEIGSGPPDSFGFDSRDAQVVETTRRTTASTQEPVGMAFFEHAGVAVDFVMKRAQRPQRSFD